MYIATDPFAWVPLVMVITLALHFSLLASLYQVAFTVPFKRILSQGFKTAPARMASLPPSSSSASK
jgi:hypothetical protein